MLAWDVSTHPLGPKARVLFSSVFGPYAQNDEFGSRSINPMELYHNQVTRMQGEFSIRMFHRTWGLMMIQQNLTNPSTLLDFPTREQFAAELKANHYDVVGISGIIVNVGKVREMCRMVRELSPDSIIVVGGHVAATPDIESMIDADHVVKGEGISWMRSYFSQDPGQPVKHPDIVSGFGQRIMGMHIPNRFTNPAATLIPSVGCPMGCNFCTTSSFFGGKGKFHNFYETGDELYEIMCGLEERLKVHSFFVMDENFLLQRKRALRLLDLMREGGKSWELYIFSSANAIRKYTMDELVQLGVSWLWLGLESPQSDYTKLQGADTVSLSRELREHGIKLLGSTIIGLEHHTPENIRAEIDYAISHDTDFHQFMLYTPVPGTPLYKQIESEGRLLDVNLADIHGQDKFNFEHAAISREASKKYLDFAFLRDFERNGPSLFRICRTTFEGWKRYRNDPDLRVRKRFARELSTLRHAYTGVLWAMERRLRDTNEAVSRRVRKLRKDILRESGLETRLTEYIVGPLMLWAAKRERKRLTAGKSYEPDMIVERRNWATAAG
jgi:radical SAM superfamily enzyme YgiQ (UPF0313 family)